MQHKEDVFMVTLARHGNFNVDVSGTILRAYISGSWNAETAQTYAAEIKSKAQPLLGSTWGHLVILEDWDLGVPEIQVIIEQLVSWCIENGLTRAAQVYSPSMVKQYQLNKMVLEEMDGFQRNSFTNEASAIAWLAAEGFSLD